MFESTAHAIEEARRETLRSSAEDPTYSELMATYVQLGELLLSGPGDEYVDECDELACRLAALGKVMDQEMDEKLVIHWGRVGRG